MLFRSSSTGKTPGRIVSDSFIDTSGRPAAAAAAEDDVLAELLAPEATPPPADAALVAEHVSTAVAPVAGIPEAVGVNQTNAVAEIVPVVTVAPIAVAADGVAGIIAIEGAAQRSDIMSADDVLAVIIIEIDKIGEDGETVDGHAFAQRLIARLVGPHGLVVGVDHEAAVLAAAAQRARVERGRESVWQQQREEGGGAGGMPVSPKKKAQAQTPKKKRRSSHSKRR